MCFELLIQNFAILKSAVLHVFNQFSKSSMAAVTRVTDRYLMSKQTFKSYFPFRV